MQLERKVLIPILAVFAVFLSVSLFIFFSGKRLHSEGEGLAESVSREYIVQYLVKVRPGAKVDAKVALPAARAAIGVEQTMRVRLRNLADTETKLKLSVTTNPDNGPNIEIWIPENSEFKLAPKAETDLDILYTLKRADLGSRDGTIDFELALESD